MQRGHRNMLRKQVLKPNALQVKQIFATIQGEGPLAGTPAIFIRLFGCNLACNFCDTDFEGEHEVLTPANILVTVQALRRLHPGCNLIVITGGEPYRQDIGTLVAHLLKARYRVQIETAGTLWLDSMMQLYNNDHLTIVCSPKTGSINKLLVEFIDAWKYIIKAHETTVEDGLPNTNPMNGAKKMLVQRPPHGHPAAVYIQPMDEQDADKNVANMVYVIEMSKQYGHRISLQQHKIMGLE